MPKIKTTIDPCVGAVRSCMNEQVFREKMEVFNKICLSFSGWSVLLNVRSASATLKSHFGDKRINLEGKSLGRNIFETL